MCHVKYTTAAATYRSLVLCDVVCVRHEEPLHGRLGFDLLPPQTGDAGQHHGFPQDRLCSRRDFHTYWLAQVDWRSMKRSQAFSTAAGLMATLSTCSAPVKLLTLLGCLSCTVQTLTLEGCYHTRTHAEG